MILLNYVSNLVSCFVVNLLPSSLAAGSLHHHLLSRIRSPLNLSLILMQHLFLGQRKNLCNIHKNVAIHLEMFSLRPQKYLHLYTPTAGTLPIAERIHLRLPSPLPVRTPILQIEKYLTLQSPSPSGKSKTVEHLACSSIPDPRHCAPSEMVSMAAAAAAVGVLLPFPFYYALWTHPQRWVDLCGRGADPCRLMAQVSHALKVLQLLALASVAS